MSLQSQNTRTRRAANTFSPCAHRDAHSIKTGTPKMENSENAMLAYNDLAAGGTSDKVYIINLDQAAGGGWGVVARYGRRGGALAIDNKTKNGPVDRAAA